MFQWNNPFKVLVYNWYNFADYKHNCHVHIRVSRTQAAHVFPVLDGGGDSYQLSLQEVVLDLQLSDACARLR